MAFTEQRIGIDPRLAIPVYRMNIRGDMETPVEEKLKIAPAAVVGGRHVLKLLDAPKAHTDGFHHVGWFDTQERGVGEWDGSSWKKLSLDTPFLSALALHVAREQMTNPKLNAYMLMGHASSRWASERTMHRCLQSVRRGHIHFSETLSGLSPYRTLFPDNGMDMQKVVTYVNIAGRISVDSFQRLLNDFRNDQTYEQTIGNGVHAVRMPRMFFGFAGFEDALEASVTLREAVKPAWEDHLSYVYGFSAGAGDIFVPVKQLPVPGVSILFPSRELRTQWGVPADTEVLVQPLTVVGPPNILVPGGAMMKWE